MTTAGKLSCAEALARLDAWMDRELAPVDAAAVGRHVEGCERCAAVVANRAAMQERLRNLVRDAEPDANLSSRIWNRIEADDFSRTRGRRGFLAAAAAVLLTAGTYVSWKSGYFRSAPESQESYIASVIPGVAPVMRIGLQQHIHCAVFRTYPDVPPSEDSLGRNTGLECQALVQVMRQHLPRDFRVVMAHRCTYHGRPYIHAVARHADSLISLLATKRDTQEKLPGESVYSSGAAKFSIAGFQTREYLIYLVSDLSRDRNLVVAEEIAPALRTTLA